MATINNDIQANCPARPIVIADTYKQEEVISFPQIAVANQAFSFLCCAILQEAGEGVNPNRLRFLNN